MPRQIQIGLRSNVILRRRKAYSKVWPILEGAGTPPDKWPGWPDKKQFALVLTHDVDTAIGQTKCYQLMETEERLGFLSSFNFVPERYNVSAELRNHLTKKGFEVGVHGLNHDGRLFQSQKIFRERSRKINTYLRAWDAIGFRSPAMHHNLDWIGDLNIEYDLSTFDTDPFEPQSDGVGTIFPFWVQGNSNHKGYVELPYTLAQDFTLFILMKEKGVDVWKKKLDWIAGCGGMALLNTHPDYMNFNKTKPKFDEYPVQYYIDFLEHIRTGYEGRYWHDLPKSVAEYCANLNFQ